MIRNNKVRSTFVSTVAAPGEQRALLSPPLKSFDNAFQWVCAQRRIQGARRDSKMRENWIRAVSDGWETEKKSAIWEDYCVEWWYM